MPSRCFDSVCLQCEQVSLSVKRECCCSVFRCVRPVNIRTTLTLTAKRMSAKLINVKHAAVQPQATKSFCIRSSASDQLAGAHRPFSRYRSPISAPKSQSSGPFGRDVNLSRRTIVQSAHSGRQPTQIVTKHQYLISNVRLQRQPSADNVHSSALGTTKTKSSEAIDGRGRTCHAIGSVSSGAQCAAVQCDRLPSLVNTRAAGYTHSQQPMHTSCKSTCRQTDRQTAQ